MLKLRAAQPITSNSSMTNVGLTLRRQPSRCSRSEGSTIIEIEYHLLTIIHFPKLVILAFVLTNNLTVKKMVKRLFIITSPPSNQIKFLFIF